MSEVSPNLENIRSWHDALISGRYQQTLGRLRRTTSKSAVLDGDYPAGHCCLGVVCDLADPGGWEEGPKEYIHRNMQNNELSDVAMDWLGVSSSDPVLKVPKDIREADGGYTGQTCNAITLNDEYRLSFVDIAACIRETWPKAFTS